MPEREISEDELEEELKKALSASDKKRDVFEILRREKESLKIKESRMKEKFKY
ncbi:MAG: hypothetical protein ACFFDH_04285 [Promethearchaeota archaeon]